MDKGFPNMRITLVKVIGEVLFVFGLLGWTYGATIQLAHPN